MGIFDLLIDLKMGGVEEEEEGREATKTTTKREGEEATVYLTVSIFVHSIPHPFPLLCLIALLS